jgi:cyclophilin family peptidyl-prolyl cis-trans isomerase
MFSRTLIFLALLTLVIGLTSCDDKKKPASQSAKPVVKTGVAPIADPEVAIIEMEQPAFGKMKMELYSNIAPQMVKRFKELATEGFYNGTTFHRVEPIVIQGGNPNSKDTDPTNDGQGGSKLPDLQAEFSDVPFERGTVGAARTADPNTANCQFYITMQRYPGWDKQYTVFGKIIEGMNNADTIAGVPKSPRNNRPLEDVKIKSITFQPK